MNTNRFNRCLANAWDNGLILLVNLLLQDLYDRKSRLVAKTMYDEQSVYIDLRDHEVYSPFSGKCYKLFV